jgi:hypothetical protein
VDVQGTPLTPVMGPQVRETHEGLRKRRLDEFMAGFNNISLKLKEMYQMITLGGDAELELVDSLDPFSEVRMEGPSMPCSRSIGTMIVSVTSSFSQY